MNAFPKGATRVTVDYGPDVFIRCPALGGDGTSGWDLWDRRPVRQGARLVESFDCFARAERAAKALAAERPRERR